MSRPPRSILIIGSGVFGLSTAWALTKRSSFEHTAITVVDDARGASFPPGDSASVDSSRIVRADYADPDYAELAALAQKEWRKQGDEELGGQGRYTESGLLLAANESAGPKMSGMGYTRSSWENASRIARKSGQADKIRLLETTADLQRCLGVDGHPGDWGYVNGLSGWANAREGMLWMYERIEATGRVSFVDAQAEELVTEGKRVVGARLDDSRVLSAEVVFVAAGAWTGSLIDLRGRVEATAQPLGYIDISEEEFQVLAKQPVVLNLSTGLFIIPPQSRVLKAARHSFGYLNPVLVEKALPPSPSEERRPIIVSRPLTQRDGSRNAKALPADADEALRQALRDLSPVKGLDTRPWRETRLCWYSDTSDGNFLADWHPGWEGLFVATGDSGHAYKFLPVLGDKLVDCMAGTGGRLGAKWKWKKEAASEAGREIDGKFKGLVTMDGSRGGRPGLILQEELLSAR
ncbi:FAD dependent oxidoreductase [Trichoderma citrinoviride]|uniref:FAD dependent oxidoreductase n=1 Tax=Trichoderma citrinoviride TaxID=58853 RepID=A0A2T4BI25_9HYPO|nr:FAD dependent oxidoreductase [Trichoderma citrinoviride]PTB68972.1 FAD dependent oxidoreductase [Trichoderma citrinoviride]